MVKMGMIIGDRYEILERIGTGGMSDVYKAKCHKLNRFVAVKVLKQEFSENANFVSKFKIEAQAAAGLMHPNIVNVYDVGEEQGIHYIVMELVEGITLKKYIEKKARLSYKEAVSIAIQVSMGIESAHNNHIIHRDIKPQNIIISKEGKVKVTDFGIAKAATSNTITSNVMGSVHYTSPEQARGGYSDEKSDIYSLGVTMFEMLTGRVPFNGETTVAIAIKHIQEEMPSPREFVAEIPISVENIVMKCCQKSPDRRYQNMQELIVDLKKSLVNPDDNFVAPYDGESEGSTRMMSEADVQQIKRKVSKRERQPEYEEYQNSDRMRLREEVVDEYDDPEDEYDYDYNPKMEKLTTILAILAGIIICIIVIFLAMKFFGNFQSTGEKRPGPIVSEDQETVDAKVKMPRVTGLNSEDAKKKLIDKGLIVRMDYEDSDTVDAGMVIRASETVDTELQRGTEVTLIVSSGMAGIEVPDLTEKSRQEAGNILRSKGFVPNEVLEYSDEVDKDYIISQNPDAGTKAPKGSVITITISKGKEEEKIRVPNVVGKSEDDATIMLIESGLQVGNVSYVFSTEQPVGCVFYQSYSQGSYVDSGTMVDLKISKGTTYKYQAMIEAPTVAEAPDYVTGSTVRIRLIADDGTQLLETEVNSFPYATPNFTGLTCSGGRISMSYTVTIGGSTHVNPETGETETVPGEAQERAFTREVSFELE